MSQSGGTPHATSKKKYPTKVFHNIFYINSWLILNTVLPRVESPGLYLIFGVKSGDSIRGGGGVNRGGVNKFRREGAKLFTFFKQKCVFLCCLVMKYYLYCLLNMSIFTIFKLQLSQFKITQLFI